VSARDLRRWLSTVGPWALDALLALVSTGFGVVALVPVLPFSPGQPRTVAAYALILAHSLPIALRRRFPVAVLGCGLATGLAFASLGLNLVPLGLGILIYVYSVAALRPRRVSLAATEAMMALVFVARPRALGDRTTASALPDGRVDEVLGQVGLADAAGRRVGGFSLGMRQRLGLAAALRGAGA
jgi:hypothetical protein